MHKLVINPYLAVFLGVMAISTSAIFTKLAQAAPVIIAFYRLGFTVLILMPFMFIKGRQGCSSFRKKDIIMACLAGIMLALHFTAWIASLDYTSVTSSTVLVTMQPVFVIGGGYLFFKEKITFQSFLGAGLAILGCVLIGVSDLHAGGDAVYGDILAFTGAAMISGYVLIGRGLRARLPLIHYTLMVYGMSVLVLLAWVFVLDLPLGGYSKLTWIYLGILAVLPTIAGHTVLNWALRYVKAAIISVGILGEPVGATILAYFIFHQVPTFLQVAGAGITILGLIIFTVSSGGNVVESE
ncbi:MAG: DMT family transporter [Clostridiales bacterium]|nr:DMT family transporter [Clostridiales bacterium]MCF8022033.1 DMT family transporter [Clostridiales bacterium]